MHIQEKNYHGKTTLIRVDFNVPMKAGKIIDNARMVAALPSIKKVIQDGGKAILMSHLGRPKGEKKSEFSLKPLAEELNVLMGVPVHFVEDCIGPEVEQKVQQTAFGEILLLENLRFYPQEKKGDKAFAQSLAYLADEYVNDAFGTAHRAHASTSVVAQFFEGKKAFGYLMAKEIENAKKILQTPQKPFVAIMGGAKVSDKIAIIENLLPLVDHLIIGGGMAYTFLKALGGEIGNSLLEEDRLELCQTILSKAKEMQVQIHLPHDSLVANAFSEDADKKTVNSMQIPEAYMGLDIGAKAIESYAKVIQSAQTILWNGPMGVFEMESYEKGTLELAASIAKQTEQGAYSLIGGGDSAAAIKQLGYEEKVSYVSTGGGALLSYFEGKGLPGIQAILE